MKKTILTFFQELMDAQEKSGGSKSMAIARCYPMKNRDQQLMPCKCSYKALRILAILTRKQEFNT